MKEKGWKITTTKEWLETVLQWHDEYSLLVCEGDTIIKDKGQENKYFQSTVISYPIPYNQLLVKSTLVATYY